MATVAERAAAGAALLDEREPDWYSKIDCANLEITSGTRCVLGQLYGGYGVGVTRLGLGYYMDMGGYSYGFTGASEELNEAWREEIAQRRLKTAPVQAAA